MADETPEKKPASPLWAGIRAGAISAVVAGALAGGGAWYTEHQAGAEKAAELQGQIDSLNGVKTALEAKVQSAINDKRLLQVRVDLSRAENELRESNFGVAKKHLDAARKHFAEIQPSPSAELGAALTGFEVKVTDDLEMQIDKVEGMAEQLDGMLSAP